MNNKIKNNWNLCIHENLSLKIFFNKNFFHNHIYYNCIKNLNQELIHIHKANISLNGQFNLNNVFMDKNNLFFLSFSKVYIKDEKNEKQDIYSFGIILRKLLQKRTTFLYF